MSAKKEKFDKPAKKEKFDELHEQFKSTTLHSKQLEAIVEKTENVQLSAKIACDDSIEKLEF